MITRGSLRTTNRHIGTLRRSSLGVFTAIYLFQFIALLLPRDGGFAAVTYASPLVTTLALLMTRLSQLRLTALFGLVGIALQSLVLVLFGKALALNIILSFATYSSLYLVTLSQVPLATTERIVIWRKLLIGIGAVVSLIGFAQLVAKGFPFLLPYRDYSPDVFEGPYGAGGHRLVPLLAGPALLLSVARVATGAQKIKRLAPSLILLTFGLVVPGANAVMMAFIVATALLLGAFAVKRFAYTLVRRRFRKAKHGRVRTWTVAILTGTIGLGLFIITGLGSLPHVLNSLDGLVPQSTQSDSMPNPRLLGIASTFTTLPTEHPFQPIFGVGLGNYSSWSQLLLSGVYVDRFLGGRLSGLPVSYSEITWNSILWHLSPEAFNRYGRWYLESIATQPWFSWQSLYAETGALGLALLALAFSGLLRRLRITKRDDRELVASKYALRWYLWFAILAGFIDNFYEYPWLLVPLLLGLLALPSTDSRIAEQQ